jgi:hypothetical protein
MKKIFSAIIPAIIFALNFLAVFFLGAHSAFAGFGITPPYLRSDTLTQGSHFTQEIIIVRGDPVEDLQTDITLNVPGISQWISVDKGLKFILPKGQQQVPIILTVDVPKDAEFGAYTGNIRIRTSSLEGPTTGVSIALGAQVDVDLKVVNEIYNFEVRRIELSEAEEGHKVWWLDFPGKIKFWMHVENTGNVPSAPSRVHFDIYSKVGAKLLESVDSTNNIEKIEPFATKKVLAELPTWLPPGGYLIKFSIYKKDQVSKSGELTLSILPRGTIPGYEGYGFMGLSLGDKLSIIGPVSAPILLGGTYRLARTRRRSRKKKSRVPSEGQSEVPVHHHDAVAEAPATRRTAPISHGAVVDLSRKKNKE